MSGCASAPLASESADLSAKRFSPPSDKSNIYIVREDALLGSAILYQITLDGRMIGGIVAGTYLLAEVTPGRHVVSVFTVENEESVPIEATAGRNIFVEVVSSIGFSTWRGSISAVNEQAGRSLVQTSRRAKGLGLIP